MKYGFSGLNKNLNSQLFNISRLTGDSISKQLITSVRVKSIVLNETHPRFIELGEWNSLGAIEYELVTSPNTLNPFPVAYPINTNIKSYPLVNEIVYIIALSDTGIGGNSVSARNYYIGNVNLWNHPHHNGYPINTNQVSTAQNKDYTQTQLGNVSQIVDTPIEIFLGNTFKERANIHPLLSFEGDIIYEGRWGNSIRLGSTVQNATNNWSSTGTNGDPITIIRNGQGSQSEEGWIPVVENLDIDDSSIYLASTQQIPLKAASTDYTSYTSPPASPNTYTGPQIILDSGRLVFNSYSDHILLSSAKSINLNSQESVNIDTKKFITQADKIFLGKEELATQPLMLGSNTVDLLKNLTSAVKELANTLKTLQSAPVAPGSPASFPTLLVPMSQLVVTLESLENQLNKGVLTSQRNFTL